MYSLLSRISDFLWQHDFKRTISLLRAIKTKFFKTTATGTSIAVSQLEEKLLFLRDIMKVRSSLSVLEIGPKTGNHSLFIDRFFKPKMITFLDRPSKENLISKWIHQIKSPNKVIYSDLLAANIIEKEKYDIIFCLGVVYHNVEYFKTLKFLRSLLKDDGYLVLGTVLSYDKKSSIIINYTKGQKFDFTRPSKKAIENILEMTGFDKTKSLILPYPNQRGFFIYKAGQIVLTDNGVVGFGDSTV
jgi:2-polyprenyl-3-methyl-5-hydroxy-6-metoxy-1,4-benzoquinol methylase